MSKEFLISIDVAKNVDRTAISIGQKQFFWGNDGRATSRLMIKDLQMVEHMTYPELVSYVKRLDSHADLHGNNELIVDATGVGEVVCDMLVDVGLVPNRIVYTGGTSASIRVEKNGRGIFMRTTVNVPKEELVLTLRNAMQQGRVKYANGIPFKADILKQFEHFEGVLNSHRRVIYNNDSDNVHDDIISSASMMAWWFMQHEGARKDFRYSPDIDEKIPMRHGKLKRTTDYDFYNSI